MDPAHLRLILGIIVIALALSRAVEHHAAGRGLLLLTVYGEEGLSRGNIQKLIVPAALRSLGHHDALAQQPVDPTAADKKGLIQDDNFIIRFSEISGVGIHGWKDSFQIIWNGIIFVSGVHYMSYCIILCMFCAIQDIEIRPLFFYNNRYSVFERKRSKEVKG